MMAYSTRETNLEIELHLENLNDEISMEDINIVLFKYARKDIQGKPERRGKMYWRCREKKFVFYRSDHMDSLNNMASGL